MNSNSAEPVNRMPAPVLRSLLPEDRSAAQCQAVTKLEAMQYGFIVVTGAIVLGLLVARARRRGRRERDELRTHVRHLSGPSDPSM